MYDLIIRLSMVGWNGWFVWRELVGLRAMIIGHPFFEGDWAFLAGLMSRIGMALFLFLLAFFFATRRLPLRRYRSWRPRIDAMLGFGLVYPIILFMPRAPLDYGFDLASSVLLAIGAYICLLSVATLGRSLSVMPEARRLVTDGLYSHVRHPLYLGEYVAQAGIFLQFRSWQAAALLLLQFYFQVRRMDWEERILVEAFPEYEPYRRRSWRLVPGVY